MARMYQGKPNTVCGAWESSSWIARVGNSPNRHINQSPLCWENARKPGLGSLPIAAQVFDGSRVRRGCEAFGLLERM